MDSILFYPFLALEMIGLFCLFGLLFIIILKFDFQSIKLYTKVKLPGKRQIWMLLFCLVVTFSLFGNNLNANWGIIDDHEIMLFIGNRQNLPAEEFLSTVMRATEIGNPGGFYQGYQITEKRFRPFYYPMRVIESIIWGKNVRLWYAFRLLIIVASLYLILDVIKEFIGLVPSVAFVLYVMTYSYWGNLFSRLGPGEIYTVLGLTLFIWAYKEIFSNGIDSKLNLKSWFVMTLGFFICIGSKENFLILTLPMIFVFIRFLNAKSFQLVPGFCIVLCLVIALITGLIIIQRLSINGLDVYQQPVNQFTRLSRYFDNVQLIDLVNKFSPFIILLIGTFILFCGYLFPEEKKWHIHHY